MRLGASTQSSFPANLILAFSSRGRTPYISPDFILCLVAIFALVRSFCLRLESSFI